jgi:hypothetical protein
VGVFDDENAIKLIASFVLLTPAIGLFGLKTGEKASFSQVAKKESQANIKASRSVLGLEASY